ncbi:unnamed protein product, partial [Adineta ricciae]
MIVNLILIISLLICPINAIIISQVHRSSLYQSNSSCALLSNITLPTDPSIQSCIWQCAHQDQCRTAVYFHNNRTCFMFSDDCQSGNITSSGDVRASVICYRRNQGQLIVVMTLSSLIFCLGPNNQCSPPAPKNVSCGYSCLNTTISRTSTFAFYTFDNNTFDTVGNYSLNGNFTLSYVPGWIGSAINFTYNNSKYLSTQTHIPLDSHSFTIDLWFYVTDLTSFKDLQFGGECQSSTTDECLFLNVRFKLLRIGFFGDDTCHYKFINKSMVSYGNRTVGNNFLGTTGLFTIGGGQIGGDAQPTVYYSGSIDHFGISYRVKSPCEIYLNARLFCYFQFESFSPLIDSGPNRINATNSNGIQTSGRVNQGIQFSSSLSYVTIEGVNFFNMLNSPFTISMWIKPLSFTGACVTFLHTSTQSDGLGVCFSLWGFSLNGSLIVNFIDSSNQLTSMMISNSFPLNQWTHLLQRYDPSSGTDFYINGTLIMSNASLSTRSPVGSYVFLGSSPTNATSCQGGSIG